MDHPGGDSASHSTELPAYAELRQKTMEQRASRNSTPGDPKASAAAILDVVDAAEPPLRVFFGTAPLGIAKADYARRIETWEQWNHVAEKAQG